MQTPGWSPGKDQLLKTVTLGKDNIDAVNEILYIDEQEIGKKGKLQNKNTKKDNKILTRHKYDQDDDDDDQDEINFSREIISQLQNMNETNQNANEEEKKLQVEPKVLNQMKTKMLPQNFGMLLELIKNGETSIKQSFGLFTVLNSTNDLIETTSKICNVFIKKIIKEKFQAQQEAQILELLKNGKDQKIANATREFRDNGDINKFIKKLRKLMLQKQSQRQNSNSTADQQSKTLQKMRNMVEGMDFSPQFLQRFRKKFNEHDSMLQNILLNFHDNYNLSNLKNQLSAFINPLLALKQQDQLQQIRQIIKIAFNCKITESQIKFILNEHKLRNSILLGGLQLHKVTGDYDDLRQTFQAVLKKKLERKDSDTSNITVSNPPMPPRASLGLIQMTKAPGFGQSQNSKTGKSQMMNDRSATPESFLNLVSTPQNQDFQNSMQDDNDKKRFKNHQHQIVAKLAKDGNQNTSCKNYSSVNIQKQLVDQDNKNIIYSFEVFAITKNKQDFSQNLRLISNIFYHNDCEQVSSSQDSGDMKRSPTSSQQLFTKGGATSSKSNGGGILKGDGGAQDDESEKKESFNQVLKKMTEEFNLSSSEEEKFYQLLKNKNKSLIGALSLYQINKDPDELKETIQVLISGIKSSKKG